MWTKNVNSKKMILNMSSSYCWNIVHATRGILYDFNRPASLKNGSSVVGFIYQGTYISDLS